MSRISAALAILAFFAVPAAAQQKPMNNMPGMDMHETRSAAQFRPGLGDLMTMIIQPHHTKLGLAGMARNWPLAAYELDELSESFDTVGKLILRHGNLDIPPALASTVKPAMEAVDKAIAAKDAEAFTRAYGDLTASCNACHQSGDHAMIVIQSPSVGQTSFPDQDFNARK